MLSTKRLYRLGFAVLVGATTLHSATENAQSEGPGGAEVRAAGVPYKRLVATPGRSLALLRPSQTCALGAPSECFETLPPRPLTLNPASFFNRRESTTEEHYFMKLFENDTGGPVIVAGMGFLTSASDEDFNEMKAVGGIYAGPNALLPSPEALLNLPFVDIAAADSAETCVKFVNEFGRPEHIDTRGTLISGELVLEDGEFAWLVLRFPLTGSESVKIAVDADPTDHPCDLLSIDGGQTWYQPDPVTGPIFDWGITAYTNEGQNPPHPAPPTWSTVKKLYNDE